MRWLQTVAVAFSMFSRIPMPRVEWNERNMRYMTCMFPLVGAASGLLLWGWQWFAGVLRFGNLLNSAGFVLIPVLVTGGIHLDGFCDTVDALSSHAPREKKLEILKDPHTGAFAAIGVVCYFLLYFSLCAELDKSADVVFLLGCGFVLERILSGLSVLLFPKAKRDGLVKTFEEAAAARKGAVILFVQLAVIITVVIMGSPLYGTVLCVASGLVYGWYYWLSKRQFGGITGDLAGWFLQVCEIVLLAALVLAQKICEVGL